ncbi:hypothetical protein [Stigmatella erecta]|uniref:hypothetical protein n=1 Tax=Stigmatella erecta TaxID=83460 RepID=UPI001160458D|nr:hypothetical protein [Stigmatella erecta]
MPQRICEVLTPKHDEGLDLLLEIRELREELRTLRADLASLRGHMISPTPVVVGVEEAGRHLGCGRTKIFELLKSGMLEQAPKVGRSTMVTVASIHAYQQVGSNETTQQKRRRKLKARAPASKAQSSGREAREAILKLVRPARRTHTADLPGVQE